MNFQEPVWVRAEIMQANQSRGHTYLELVQKNVDDDGIAAQVSAALWSRQRTVISTKIGAPIDQFLRNGSEVSLLVDVTYHSIYGLTLSVTDLDPTYTLGKLQLVRQQTIEKLHKEKLLTRNKEIEVPLVMQRIAVISAPTSAGYQDFIQQLADNEYGYDYSVTLFANAMQGLNVEHELIENLQTIHSSKVDFDCVVIIRGGGSRIDLRAFDQYPIAKAIALLDLPVLCGIGHETDTSVVDMVANLTFKTPTAVAAHLIDTSLTFETKIITLLDKIEKGVQSRLGFERQRMVRLNEKLMHAPKNLLTSHRHQLNTLTQELMAQFHLLLNKEQNNLVRIKDLLRTLDPQSILDRGYVFVKQNKKVVKRASDVDPNQPLFTSFTDGTIESQVQ